MSNFTYQTLNKMEKTQQTTTNIKAPNENLIVLKKHFSHCFDKNGDVDFDKLKQELSSSEVNFSKESYSLDWLGKSYARLLAVDEATTLLSEDTEFNQKPANKNSQNLLLKGDNLEILKHLSNAYHQQVKMIYIDPPYNTGSDGFVYQDTRKFSNQELQELAGVDEQKAQRILDFTMSKSNSHSAWLTFMYPRLYIAKQLLKDDGVIFVSIDDNEVAQLRVLMDEIFGEENFVGELIHQRAKGGGQANNIVKGHDYVLVYAKKLSTDVSITRQKVIQGKVIKKDNKSYLLNDDVVRKKFGKYDSGIDRRCAYEELSKYKNESQIKTIEEKLKNKEYFLQENDKGLNIICELIPIDNARSKIYSIINSDDTIKVLSEKGKKDLEKLKIPIFDYPKPVELIDFIINSVNFEKNDIVLDFFAGSGTTGHSAMNAGVKFILIQINEILSYRVGQTSEQKNNILQTIELLEKLGVKNPTIFEITKERLIRSAKKIQKDNEALKEKDKKDLSKQDFGFKIFETTPIWESYKTSAKEVGQYNLFKKELTEKDTQTLLTTWKTNDGALLTDEVQNVDLGGYVGHIANGSLYLMYKGFATDNLVSLLGKINNNELNISSVIAFVGHMDDKSLREISDGLKLKTSNIDFIIRH
jgi:adenine-specific DNA-methyltransferase